MKWKEYLWYAPALYVAFMFGNKLLEGLSHSAEFITIISTIPFLAPFAYNLSVSVGILDACVAAVLLLNPLTVKSRGIQRFIFVWTILWPFVPGTLRLIGGGDFEVIEVLSISLSSALAFFLWERFAKHAPHQSMTYSGLVQVGLKRATDLGFPTVNISFSGNESGIYAADVAYDGRTEHAVVYADQKRKLLEAHLLSVSENLYGKTITIALLKKLRADMAFSNDAQLKAAIIKDAADARAFFTSDVP